jgi:type VI secretion system protein ImpD/type VI secretion system protein ImpC
MDDLPSPDGAAAMAPPPDISAAAAATDSVAARRVVLAGGFFGRAGADAAEALADFLAEPSAAAALRRWFGAAALARLLRQDAPEGEAPRAAAIARLEEAVDRDIAAIDAALSAQLDAVLAEERFRRLEGSWRGLWWLLGRIPPGTAAARIRIRLLVLRWPELCRAFERAAEFDQSQLFRKVYEEEFGTAGGEPYGLLCGDWQVRPFPGPGSPTDDVGGLDGLAAVAAAAFAPTVVAAHPALIGIDDFAELGAAVDPVEPMRGTERRRWRGLQDREDTRFLGVLLPRALARGAWPDDGVRADGFRFRTDPGEAGSRAWMSPIYPFAAIAVRAFATWGWPADIRGAAIGDPPLAGVVDRLPVERLPADPPGAAPPRPPVEVALTDEQERSLVEAGLLPMIGLEAGLPEAVFAAAPSLHRPPRMGGQADASAIATGNQRLSAQFNAMLCVSRFAHCVKVMGRQMVGSFQTAEQIEGRLQEWLLQFASANTTATGETGARQPLRNARVQVEELPGKPGVFGCVIHLQPHYQLDEVGAAFRLVTELDAPRAAA